MSKERAAAGLAQVRARSCMQGVGSVTNGPDSTCPLYPRSRQTHGASWATRAEACQ